MNKPAWSHSSLKNYETCPRQYHEVKVLKRYPRQETEQTIYGTQGHKSIEDYIKSQTPMEGFERFKPVVDALLAKPGRKYAEYEMALTEQLNVCRWDYPLAWVRGIADLLIINDDDLTATVCDWKFGNNKYPDLDQLTLMSLLVFAHFPNVRLVRSALFFLLKDDMRKQTMERDEADAAWWRYRERVARRDQSFDHDVWHPRQSGLCKKYCVVTTCEHNGNYGE